jgi:hypothetical protein
VVAITINRALSRKRFCSVACTGWEVVRRKGGVDMAYIRKTKDEYQLLCDYGDGWEYLLAENTMKEARKRKREYIENMPEYSYRIVKKRIPIEGR